MRGLGGLGKGRLGRIGDKEGIGVYIPDFFFPRSPFRSFIISFFFLLVMYYYSGFYLSLRLSLFLFQC